MKTVKSVERRSTAGINSTAHHETRSTANRGFTLVELMVVITVIAVLVALLGASLAYMGQQAKETATNTTIKKIQAQLEQRVESFDREMERLETFARNGAAQSKAPSYYIQLQKLNSRLSDDGMTGLSGEGLILLLHKDLMRQKFPQVYGDSPSIDAGFSGSNVVSNADSSELLYRILTTGEGGGAATVDAGEFLASEVGDTDGDTRLEFIDAWGNPLRFYRWPTRLIRPNFDPSDPTADDPDHVNAPILVQGLPAHAQESLLKTDPHDPLQLLEPAVTFFDSNPPDFESRYHTPNTYSVPLIVSVGADGVLGMGEPNSSTATERLALVTDASAITDNITNRNQRAGD